jgi:chromosome segregation ATPase
MENQTCAMDKRLEEVDATAVKNAGSVKEIFSKLSSQESRTDSLESDSNVNKNQITSVNERIETIKESMKVYESRHSETFEKIKEVKVFASNIENNVKAHEQRMEKNSANEINQLSNQLDQLMKDQVSSFQKVTEINDDHKSLQDKVLTFEKNMESKLKEVEQGEKKVKSNLDLFREEAHHKIDILKEESKYNGE